MASFSVGANAFLSSPHKHKIFAPNPTTERGASTVVNAHPSLPLVIYPSGKFIVVRDLSDAGNSFIYRGHAAPTTVAKFSSNGFWVASADITGKVRVWSWDNPEHLTKLETQVFAGTISDLDWDPENKKLVVAGDGSGVIVKCITWDTGNSAGEMVGHNKKVLSVAYRPARPYRIMSGGEDMKTQFYMGPPFKMDHSMTNVHTNFVNCVRYSPDANYVVSVGSDKKIQLYDGKTGEPTKEIPNAHTGGIYSVSWSPDSKSFITASADKTVKLWNAESLACEETFTFSENPQVGDAQVSVLWTSNFMLSVSLNGNMNVLSRSSPAAPEKVYQSQQVSITAMSINRPSKTLYTGSFDGVICARNIDGSGEATRLKGTDPRNICGGAHAGKIVGMAVVTGDLLSAGWDDKLRIGSRTRYAYEKEVDLGGQPCTLANSSGTELVLIVTNKEIALYRGDQKVSSMPADSLGFNPTCGAMYHQEEIAVGGSDFKTHIYALNSALEFTPGKTIETRSAVSALAYSPSGEFLAIGDDGRQVEVYERSSWEAKIKGKWVFHTSKITSLAWSPLGQYLASGSLDENIFVWNMKDPMSKLQLPFSHAGGVTGVGFLSVDKLISVGNDHCVVTWNVPCEE